MIESNAGDGEKRTLFARRLCRVYTVCFIRYYVFVYGHRRIDSVRTQQPSEFINPNPRADLVFNVLKRDFEYNNVL